MLFQIIPIYLQQIKNERKMDMQKITTTVYEIKVNKTWKKVRATNFANLLVWMRENNIKDYRFVGMMSNAEIKESKSLNVVA